MPSTDCFKGTVAPDFVGPFLTCMVRSGLEREPRLVYVTHSLFGSFEAFNAKTSQRFPESLRWILIEMWAADLGDFLFLLGEPLAMCKFFLEMNLRLINIIGEMFTNWQIFFHLLVVLREKYGTIINF